MRLRSPREVTWWIALVLGVLGVLFHAGIVRVAGLAEFAFWAVAIALGLLLVATRIKGL
jgi:hypothetical protein